jgi:hypothetical protein
MTYNGNNNIRVYILQVQFKSVILMIDTRIKRLPLTIRHQIAERIYDRW